MASNFEFLKGIDSKLFEVIQTAEELYRDEYFDQCMVETRKFAEKICKKLLGKCITTEKTFDDMLATLSDKSTGSSQEKELINDLYFIKREGNISAHSSNMDTPATTSLECMKRAFEVAINYAFSKRPKNTKLLKLEFDSELLITGEKTEPTLKEKYLQAKEEDIEEKQSKKDNNSKKKSKKTNKKWSIDLKDLKTDFIGMLALILIIVVYVLTFIIH